MSSLIKLRGFRGDETYTYIMTDLPYDERLWFGCCGGYNDVEPTQCNFSAPPTMTPPLAFSPSLSCFYLPFYPRSWGKSTFLDMDRFDTLFGNFRIWKRADALSELTPESHAVLSKVFFTSVSLTRANATCVLVVTSM